MVKRRKDGRIVGERYLKAKNGKWVWIPKGTKNRTVKINGYNFKNGKDVTKYKNKSSSSSSSSSNSTGTSTTDTTSSTDGSTTDTSSTTSTGTTENKWVQKTVEKPITTYSEALKFGKLEVAKSKRDNGHSVECKVIGSNKWKPGKWVLVQLPSYDINDYMYLTKTDHSQSASDEWLTGVTLQDYPPSFGSGESNKIDNSSDDTSQDTEGSGTEGDTSSTNSSTNSNTNSSTNSGSNK
jgi:hypothetical protein